MEAAAIAIKIFSGLTQGITVLLVAVSLAFVSLAGGHAGLFRDMVHALPQNPATGDVVMQLWVAGTLVAGAGLIALLFVKMRSLENKK